MTEQFSEPQGSPCPGGRRIEKVEAPPPQTALVPKIQVDMPAKADRVVSNDTIPVLDTAKFEHMYRVATAIAQSSLVPETLRVSGADRLPDHVVIANCFKVVNQAVRWGMDPFALIDCASIIKGRLCWEGKVIAAVLDSVAGIKLKYDYSGEGELMTVTVRGLIDGEWEEVQGTVTQWKTTRSGSPWANPADYKRQLAYRGAREWARRHKPAVMLGVYGSDEPIEDHTTIDVTPSRTPPAALPPRRRTPFPSPRSKQIATDDHQVALNDHYNQDLEQVAAAGDILEKTLKKDPVATAAAVDQALDAAKIASLKPPPAMPPRRTAVRSPKSIKEKKDDPFDAIEDEDIRGWCKLFRVDLKDCQGAAAVHDLLDRSQKAIDRLPVAAGKLVTALVNEVLSELQR